MNQSDLAVEFERWPLQPNWNVGQDVPDDGCSAGWVAGLFKIYELWILLLGILLHVELHTQSTNAY